jgi:twitching motility two-component system response regulator PilH
MKKILVIDDVQSELDLISEYLSQSGYTVITATEGNQALQKIQETKPDAVVTDWMMPAMGGLDLCRKLKKNPDTENIPVIACTAKNRDVDRMWAMKQGITAYVTKPCTKEDLVNAIRTAMVGGD